MGKGSILMGDCLATSCAPGTGLDISAGCGQANSVEYGPPHWWQNVVQEPISGRSSASGEKL